MMWAGVIGSPIEHSLSPVIHRAAWEDLGVEGWEYRRIEQDESSLPEFISGLDESFRGLSVTMPCKQAIIPLLDAIDPLATGVGAVNTVVRGDAGRSLEHRAPVRSSRVTDTRSGSVRILRAPWRREPSSRSCTPPLKSSPRLRLKVCLL